MSVSLGRYVNLKTITSGDRIEVYKYSKAFMKGHEGKNKVGRKGKGVANKKKNRREVLNRARNKIIRLVNCNPDLKTFISLTYKENMQDLKASKEHLNEMIKKLQKEQENFKYLYVLEFQSRGAIHFHMLCNLPVIVKTAKSNYIKPEGQRLLEQQFHRDYWEYGWVDIRDLDQEGNTNVGLYVSVYLVEDLFDIDLQGSKCYGYSRNLNRPIEHNEYTDQKHYEIVQSFPGYELKYASSYNMQFEDDLTSQVNYFDFYKE